MADTSDPLAPPIDFTYDTRGVMRTGGVTVSDENTAARLRNIQQHHQPGQPYVDQIRVTGNLGPHVGGI